MSDPQITLPESTGAGAGLRVALLALATLGFMGMWTEMERNAGVADEVVRERKESHTQSDMIPLDRLPRVFLRIPRPEVEMAWRLEECRESLRALTRDCEAQWRAVAMGLRDSALIRGLMVRKAAPSNPLWLTTMLGDVDNRQLLELNVIRGIRSIPWSDMVDAGCDQLRVGIAKRLQREAEAWMRMAVIRWQLEIHKLPRMTSGASGEMRTR